MTIQKTSRKGWIRGAAVQKYQNARFSSSPTYLPGIHGTDTGIIKSGRKYFPGSQYMFIYTTGKAHAPYTPVAFSHPPA
jgi:hypothetical protein